MRAIIYVYDELMVVDDTEVISDNKEQLANIAISMLRTTPDAKYAEVWDETSEKMIMKYSLNRKGLPKKESVHPGWGGKRKGAGRKPIGEKTLDVIVRSRVNKETGKYLDSLLDRRAAFIREAIEEKIVREKNKG